jgi:hypothetical protein
VALVRFNAMSRAIYKAEFSSLTHSSCQAVSRPLPGVSVFHRQKLSLWYVAVVLLRL